MKTGRRRDREIEGRRDGDTERRRDGETEGPQRKREGEIATLRFFVFPSLLPSVALSLRPSFLPSLRANSNVQLRRNRHWRRPGRDERPDLVSFARSARRAA